MKALNTGEIAALLADAAGDVSYIYDAAVMGVKTTAHVANGRWVSKRDPADVMREILETERKAEQAAWDAAHPPRKLNPAGKRSAPYNGPFPRGRHSHRCVNCDERAVACYRSQCRKPAWSDVCERCAKRGIR